MNSGKVKIENNTLQLPFRLKSQFNILDFGMTHLSECQFNDHLVERIDIQVVSGRQYTEFRITPNSDLEAGKKKGPWLNKEKWVEAIKKLLK